MSRRGGTYVVVRVVCMYMFALWPSRPRFRSAAAMVSPSGRRVRGGLVLGARTLSEKSSHGIREINLATQNEKTSNVRKQQLLIIMVTSTDIESILFEQRSSELTNASALVLGQAGVAASQYRR